MSARRLATALALLAGAACSSDAPDRTTVEAGASAMAVLSVTVADTCPAQPPGGAAAWSVWIDGVRAHEVLAFPAIGPRRYDTLVGQLAEGRHAIELRPAPGWEPPACIAIERLDTAVHAGGTPEHELYRRAPVLELRADTIGEDSDLPLYAYAERVPADGGGAWRYSVVFSNEDGGTPTRALFARWGRTTDIEQVYEVRTAGGRVLGEAFQGPDHVTRAFSGRRQGDAPVLLVATLNNMVIDRGRSLAAVRLVPSLADLSAATRESTMDARPWVYRRMAQELAAEGRIAPDAPLDERWPRVAPDPRSHIYLEARLRLDHAVAVAWATDGAGRRYWSHYGKMPLAIDRDGWVRTAVAVGSDPAASLADAGWACLADPEAPAGGACEIEATRAFAFDAEYAPGPNLVASSRHCVLKAGEEASLALVVRSSPRGGRSPRY